MIHLSKRMEANARLLKGNGTICDVGCDHGYLPIALVESGQFSYAIAMDLRPGPLERARIHIEEAGLGDRIETRLSDGLKSLEAGQASSLLIAGMGGKVILHILEEGESILSSFEEIILQPQSELAEVRRYVTSHGFRIVDEDMVLEDGKFYPVMRLVPGESDPLTEIELCFGPCLLGKHHEVLREFLEREYRIQMDILAALPESNEIRISEIKYRLDLIDEARNRYN